MPPWVPFHYACIVISGICEIVGAIGLVVPVPLVQLLTGLMLTSLLIAIFPANIYMAAAHIRINGIPSHQWMAWARLPLQPVIMVAVTWVTGIWPRVSS